jgi:hypothetical protein
MKTATSDSRVSQALSQANNFENQQPNSRRVRALAISSLCAIGALVYGIFVRSVGFYWDDWPVVWVYNALGSQGVLKYFTGNRPFSGWIYARLAPFFGISPVGWQAANVGVRCLASIVLYLLFCELWPKRRDVAWIVAALVLLYPGFTQQAIALTYLSQNSSFLFLVTSFFLTVLALGRPRYRWPLIVISIALGVWSYLITEYFVGLEFVRLVLIYVYIFKEGYFDRQRLQSALLKWSPYAAAWVGYVFWRSFLFHEIHYNPIADKNVSYLLTRALHNPIKEIGGIVANAIHNVVMGSFYAFLRPFMADAISPSGGKLSWVIGFVVVGISLFTLQRLTISDEPRASSVTSAQRSRGFLRDSIAMSIVGICLGGLPFISGQSAFFGRELSFGDRFTFPFMLPACIAFACFLTCVLPGKRSKAIVLGLIFFAFSVFQVQSMNLYRHDWLGQKSLFWQLAWRFPGIKPETTIFVDGLSPSIDSGETPGLLDMLYKRDDHEGKLDYFLFDMRHLPDGKQSYQASAPIVRRLRSFTFVGSTSESVVSWLSPDGTLRVVTPTTAGEIVQAPMLSAGVSHVSHPEEITTATDGVPGGPLLRLFGSEPVHEWTYFYQKAELERQLQHWDAVASLGDEAVQRRYRPTDVSEWFPFIDGYAHARRYQTAEELTETMLKESPESIAALSSLWLHCSHECSSSPELDDALRRLENKLILNTRQPSIGVRQVSEGIAADPKP